MYQYIFGPVPSRRLGISLGIDLVPHKTCSLNCVYCECGRTTLLTIERKEWVSTQKVIEELDDYLKRHPHPDFITFSGSGEPTLHNGIGTILEYLYQKKGSFKTAVLTNGTLLNNQQVRKEIQLADLVLPSLDAAEEKTFKKINRPHSSLNVTTIIEGLIQLRQEYRGQIFLEVFIMPGFNDHQKNLMALKQAILKINPDKVQLNTLDRPGAVANIRAATESELEQILNLWQLPNAEIIAKPRVRQESAAYRKDIESAILETIARRPCTLMDLKDILNLPFNELNKYLSVMEANGQIESILLERGFFYKIKS